MGAKAVNYTKNERLHSYSISLESVNLPKQPQEPVLSEKDLSEYNDLVKKMHKSIYTFYTGILDDNIGFIKLAKAALYEQIDKNELAKICMDALFQSGDIIKLGVGSPYIENEFRCQDTVIKHQNALEALKLLSPIPERYASLLVNRRYYCHEFPDYIRNCISDEDLKTLLVDIGAAAIPPLLNLFKKDRNFSSEFACDILIEIIKQNKPGASELLAKELKSHFSAPESMSDHVNLFRGLTHYDYRLQEVCSLALKNLIDKELPPVSEIMPAIISAAQQPYNDTFALYLNRMGQDAAMYLTEIIRGDALGKKPMETYIPHSGNQFKNAALLLNYFDPEIRSKELATLLEASNSSIKRTAISLLESREINEIEKVVPAFSAILELNGNKTSEKLSDLEKGRQVIPILLKNLTDQNLPIDYRISAVRSLCSLSLFYAKSEQHVFSRIKSLFTSDPYIKIIPALLKLLEPNAAPYELQLEIIYTLGESGNRGNLDPRLAKAFSAVFSKYPGDAALNEHETNMRAAAATFLSKFGGKYARQAEYELSEINRKREFQDRHH